MVGAAGLAAFRWPGLAETSDASVGEDLRAWTPQQYADAAAGRPANLLANNASEVAGWWTCCPPPAAVDSSRTCAAGSRCRGTFDAEPAMFNTLSGVLDLDTGVCRPTLPAESCGPTGRLAPGSTPRPVRPWERSSLGCSPIGRTRIRPAPRRLLHVRRGARAHPPHLHRHRRQREGDPARRPARRVRGLHHRGRPRDVDVLDNIRHATFKMRLRGQPARLRQGDRGEPVVRQRRR